MKGKAFTQTELDLLADENLTHTEIAKLTGRTTSTIALKRKAMGVSVKADGRVNESLNNDLIYDVSKTHHEVANLCHLKAKQVYLARYRRGLV